MVHLRRLVVLLLIAVCEPAYAQSGASGARLFESQEPLDLILSLNFETLLTDIGDDRVEHPAILSYHAPDGSIKSQPVEVRTRGNYRRRPENCRFPPLRLDFKKSEIEATLFDGLNKVKLVTHCRPDDPNNDQYVLQEYGLYRSYRLLTSKSFGVRLINMTYRDATGRLEKVTRPAFIIEDEEGVARRHDMKAYAREDVPLESVDFEQLTLLHLFEYMIGNIDWDVPALQNIVLIASSEHGPYYPVPYDFDLAGIISPPGADRHPRLGPTALRNVLFPEYCGNRDDLEPLLDRFREKRTSIYEVYELVPGLSPDRIRATHRFLDRFYRIIDDSSAVEREFIRPCRVRP